MNTTNKDSAKAWDDILSTPESDAMLDDMVAAALAEVEAGTVLPMDSESATSSEKTSK